MRAFHTRIAGAAHRVTDKAVRGIPCAAAYHTHVSHGGSRRINRKTRLVRPESVGCPFPDIPGHIVETVTVGGESSRLHEVFFPSLAVLPGIPQVCTVLRRLGAPGIFLFVKSASRGKFPLCLTRQSHIRPLHKYRIMPRNKNHRPLRNR